MAEGAGTGLGRRIAFVALVLGLVGGATGFVVSAGFESSRAARVERATAHTKDRTRQLQAQSATIDKRAQSARKLEKRLEDDAAVLSGIDLAPMTSYTSVNNALAALTNALNDLVAHSVPGDPRARLAPLLLVAREKLADFEKDVLGYDANRNKIRSDVTAAHR